MPTQPPPKPPRPQPLVPAPAIKGRGAAAAVAHRFAVDEREAYDDGWGTLDQAAQEEHLPPTTEIIEEQARSILSSNQSPDIPFDRSINPYRGCEHGCIYCFARPTHSYLNLSPGLDFETKIIAKTNAAALLRASLARPGYEVLPLCIGTATDAYQPVERKLGITRAIIEVLGEFRHPFSMLTKSSGVERDLDLIAPLAAQGLCTVYVSITTLDNELARRLEPRAAAPARRLRTLRALAEAGVPTGVSVSPLIPFLNEPELERVLEAAAEAGARRAFSIPLRLPWEVAGLFKDWLELHYPERAARVMARLHDMRGGRDNDPRFGSRMRGEGIWAELIRQRLKKASARLGLTQQRFDARYDLFRVPAGAAAATPPGRDEAQGELF
ncbi:MAG: PA0069 family radical SAM protein [Pelomonas sp.]|nr:PA0069 family radical SAM protein [Roseateles sp.]